MQLSVRDVDENIFRKFKSKAAEDDMPVGKVLNMAMEMWVNRKERKAKLTDLKPLSLGSHTKNLSKEIDKVLYG